MTVLDPQLIRSGESLNETVEQSPSPKTVMYCLSVCIACAVIMVVVGCEWRDQQHRTKRRRRMRRRRRRRGRRGQGGSSQ
jgi:hypothetical protein